MKIPLVKKVEITEDKLKNLQNTYGTAQMIFLLYKDKLMFVVQREQRDLNKNQWIIKTCYRIDGKRA